MSETKLPNNKERIKSTLNIDPVELPYTTKGALMSTITLSKYVNVIMRGVFKDYLGCKIYPVLNDQYSGRHPVRCDLSFSLGADNKAGSRLAAFKTVADPVKASMDGQRANYTDMISRHNALLKSLNSAVITQDAVDIIHPLLWEPLALQTKESPSAYQQKGIVKEQSTPTQYNVNNNIITPIISFIDINAIFSTIVHGSALDEKGRRYGDVEITPLRSIVQMNNYNQFGYGYAPGPGNNYLYQVNIIDKDALNDIANEIGFINKNGYTDCYTETF